MVPCTRNGDRSLKKGPHGDTGGAFFFLQGSVMWKDWDTRSAKITARVVQETAPTGIQVQALERDARRGRRMRPADARWAVRPKRQEGGHRAPGVN